MPGKSKRKKMRYSSNNQNRAGQPQVKTTAQATVAGAAVATKPQTAPVKSSAAGKAATAQLDPEQFKHVGSELRVVGILSAFIIVVIVVLFFILH
jgi:hemoglobin-like flavoprotein